ncbi:unnamed protein product, partial [Heterobilharzia americana]
MLTFSEASFPARQLFAFSMDKELLSKRRQEEVDNVIRSSTERLWKTYNFSVEYILSDHPSKLSLPTSKSIQPERILVHSSECSSSSKITTEQVENENNSSCDMWRWEIIDAISQYIPSFYLRKQYHSDGRVIVDKYEDSCVPRTAVKEIRDMHKNQPKVEKTTYLLTVLKNEDSKNSKVTAFKVDKCSPSKINSWDIPIRKWL